MATIESPLDHPDASEASAIVTNVVEALRLGFPKREFYLVHLGQVWLLPGNSRTIVGQARSEDPGTADLVGHGVNQ
jgi:hypothetical protein